MPCSRRARWRRRVHDTRSEITTLVNLGSAYVTFGDTSEGVRYLEAALTRARTIDFRSAEAYALLWLGIGASRRRRAVAKPRLPAAGLAIQTAIKDVRGQATTMRQLAAVQLELGSPQDALSSITKSVEMSPQAAGLIYTGALTLANVHAALGDTSRSSGASTKRRSHRFREIRARHAESLALTQYGRFQARQGRDPEARDLLETGGRDSRVAARPDRRSRPAYELRQHVDRAVSALRRRADGAGTQVTGDGFAAEAFHTNERARARGLLELLATSGVDIRPGRRRGARRARALASLESQPQGGDPDDAAGRQARRAQSWQRWRRRSPTLSRDLARDDDEDPPAEPGATPR